MDMAWLDWLQQALTSERFPWLWEVFVVVFVTLALSYLLKRVLRTIETQLAKTPNMWDDALLAAADKPAFYWVWLLGFNWVADTLARNSGAAIFSASDAIRQVLTIVLLAWFVYRLIAQVELRLVSGQYSAQPADETTVMAIAKLLRTALVITAVLMILQTLGYSISGVLAFGGIGGLAVGFAAKDLLSNFFGGLMVYLDRPFSVGDWIRSPDKEIEGVVERIGWRQTCIRTFDKRPLYVPNATFAQIAVENPSRMSNRRIYETIGLRYDDARQVAAVVDDVHAMLAAHPDIDHRQTLIVNFNRFGPSSLDFFVYTFTKTTDWIAYHQIKQAILLQILDIVHLHGADVAYPTTTVKLPEAVLLQERTIS